METNDSDIKVTSAKAKPHVIGEDKERAFLSYDALSIYDEETKITERPQLIREYLTEMLESNTHQWYYKKDRNKALDDIKCIVRVLELLEE